jgi:peptide/nickel transport system permease protein
MERYLAGRVAEAALALVILSIVIFCLGRMTGSPVNLMLPSGATQAEVDRLEAALGLKQPIYVQYAKFLLELVHGNLGTSLLSRQRVVDLFFARFPATVQLTAMAVFLLMVVGIPLGVLAALTRGGFADLAIRIAAAVGQAVPTFWLGIMLVLLLGVWLRVLPVAGRGGWEHMLMPVVSLSLWPLAGVIRFTRSGVLAVLGQAYVTCARSKGLPERLVLGRHVMKNSLLPVVTFSGVIVLSAFLTGSVVVETIFAWPGVGYLAYQAVIARDFPVLQGVVLIFGAMFILANLVVDLSYCYLDPRIRFEE